MGVYFVACPLCVICLLHKGRSGAGQCDQDTRLTSKVGNNKEKIRTQIVESVGIRSYILNTFSITSTMPTEASLASMAKKSRYHR